MTKARYKRIAWGAAAAMTASFALAGFVHTAAGRALWSRATGSACPFGGKTLTAAQVDARMRQDDAGLRGAASAGAKPALGFALTATRREAFATRARALGGHCYDRDAGLTLECAEVPLAALSGALEGASGTLWARFDQGDRLRELTAISRASDSRAAARALDGLKTALTAAVGPPHATRGAMSADALARGALAQGTLEYRFKDYYAKVSATNMGGADGFRILQRYRAVDD